MVYSSVENKKIKDIKKLSTKKYRDLTNTFLIEGEHLVKEAYKTGYLKELLLVENNKFSLGIETNYITRNVLNYITNLDTPQEVLGICKKNLSNVIKGDRILILDNIQDPGNLGTIIRSAVAFNIDTIILSKDCVDIYNSKVVRATQGLLFNINIVIENLEKIIPTLKEKGYKIMGTKVTNGKSLKSIEKCQKFAIIMGNEGSGVQDKILDICDEYLYIDMNKNCESLNVGVATSIILYELDK